SASDRVVRRPSNTSATTPTSRARSRRRCANGPAPAAQLRRRRRMPTRARPKTEPTGDAYDAAVRYLAARPRTVAEIHRHLRGKRFDDDAVDRAIEKLRAQRYVDD